MPAIAPENHLLRVLTRILKNISKLSLLALLLAAPTEAAAYVGDYDGLISIEPVAVKTGEALDFSCKSENVARQRIEVGIHPVKTGKTDWTLELKDSVNSHTVLINARRVERNKFDFDHDESILVTIFVDGEERLTKDFGNKLPITRSPIYLRVQTDGKTIALSAGDRLLEPSGSIPYKGFFDSASVYGKYDIIVDRHSAMHNPEPVIPQIYPDEKSVMDALRQCSDCRCSVWEFFDEEVETRIAVKGGRYKLALLPSENGGYDLIYISGAETEPFRWKAGALKGHLIPTPFANTFTLYWIDSTGKEIADMAPYATIDDLLMSLVFPIHKAKFRLVKTGL